MNVTLAPEDEALITAKVRSGRYASSADVIRQALQLLDEKEAKLLQEQQRKRQAAQAILDSIAPINVPRDSVDIIREERDRLDNRV